MARAVRNPKIDTRSARSKLPQRREPYSTVISEGCALGYRRGSKGRTWIAKFRAEDGKAREQAGDVVTLDRTYTVDDTIADYLAEYKRRSGKAADRIEAVARA